MLASATCPSGMRSWACWAASRRTILGSGDTDFLYGAERFGDDRHEPAPRESPIRPGAGRRP